MEQLKAKISTFPKKPGVYLMKNKNGKVLYVGKAVNLKSRISNYFGKGRDKRAQIEPLMEKVINIEYIVTKTEKEALLLEYNLIQEHKPKYNIFFKDSKSYVSIKITKKHSYPGIYVVRKTPKDGSLYFGPYTSSTSCREIVELLISSFQIRNCRDTFFANRSRPCIQYEIKRCTAPCTKLVTKDAYRQQVIKAELFLKGKSLDLITKLENEMSLASEELRYEDAALLRDTILKIANLIEPQAISGYKDKDKDYIGTYSEKNLYTFTILELRGGIIKGYNHIFLQNNLGDIKSLWEQFLIRYYKDVDRIPNEILIDFPISSLKSIEGALSERKGKKIKVKVPKKGKDLERVEMAKRNAGESFKQKHHGESWASIADKLIRKLKLRFIPSDIECVDISNISGKHAVGSIVAFKHGEANKELYRHFRIRTKDEPDDYQMMREVLTRRFKRDDIPDLLLIDGGKGHLMIAEKVLEELGVENLAYVSIAKGEKRKEDQIFLPGRKNPIKFRKNEPSYLFLKRIRDEAHRFGINYYRNRHRKEMFG